ncbi:hypothetical protein PVAND_010447 [Polypedilum vanderplanki]|uniref:Acetyl-coenzyme A transporter 1 n=1 Tax=Polypedilum vanderplanki TaxID=319348 RepID=A0A9J6CG90_POLVA|nr:hypothetical protein PVAND_010447 [Polypedilum vanderplanki]
MSVDNKKIVRQDQEHQLTIKEEEKEQQEEEEEEESDLRGDYGNVAILLFLYILQGIPLGISSAVRILLTNRGVSYKELAILSFASYPFTMKVLWSPIVDAIYFKKIGRRKSWLIPVQLMIGGFMIFLAQRVNDWMGDSKGQEPQIIFLTIVFFMLWFLTATQDIAVDGWCLTMLQRRNIGYAATCNSVGQTAGWFIGYVILLVFESKEFCNKYIFSEPREKGLLTLAGFLNFWGVVFLSTTILLALFKKERSEFEDEQLKNNPDYGIKKAYPILWKIITHKPVMKFSIILLTVKASFAACDTITSLKLIEYGVPKDRIALLAIPLVPVQIVLPFIISRYTAGPKPMLFYIKAFPYRLIMTIVIAVWVFYTPKMIVGTDFPVYYYIAIVSIYMIYQIPFRSMYVADMSFFAKISDPLVGGTYMTLMNTISNLGGSWIQTFSLWLVDIITWKRCIFSDNEILNVQNSTNISLSNNTCKDKIEKEQCAELGGKCFTDIDGYYIEICINVIYGIIWFYFGRKLIIHLQNLPSKDWYILTKKTTNNKDDKESIPLKKIP